VKSSSVSRLRWWRASRVRRVREHRCLRNGEAVVVGEGAFLFVKREGLKCCLMTIVHFERRVVVIEHVQICANRLRSG